MGRIVVEQHATADGFAVGPGRLRSDAMVILYAAVRTGNLGADQGLAQVDALGRP